jgi:polysaccharide export outer membrane protein
MKRQGQKKKRARRRGPPLARERQRRRCWPIVLLLFVLGCAAPPSFQRSWLSGSEISEPTADQRAAYRVGCPDELEIHVSGQPELNQRVRVAVDGRIDLGPAGRLYVEGLPTPVIAEHLAHRLGIPAAQVTVRVVGYHSQQVYLFGEVNNLQRAVPYCGPETVVELLRRAGGLTAEAAPDHVYVVRPHVVDGTRPEVFHVDLRAILLQGDERTNVRLQPFDQVHVGETRRAKWERCLPPWLRPLLVRLGSLPPTPAPAP